MVAGRVVSIFIIKFISVNKQTSFHRLMWFEKVRTIYQLLGFRYIVCTSEHVASHATPSNAKYSHWLLLVYCKDALNKLKLNMLSNFQLQLLTSALKGNKFENDPQIFLTNYF